MATQEQKVAAVERRAKEAEIMLDLRDHPVMRPIFDRLRSDVDAMNHKLMRAEMDAPTRSILMAKRDFVEDFVGLFVGAEITLENAKKALERLAL